MLVAVVAVAVGVGVAVGTPRQPSALPRPADAATSAEQIAQRLNGHLVEDPESGSDRRSRLVIEKIMEWVCPQGATPGAPSPPSGIPAYTGRVRVNGVATPLDVRFWVDSPWEARSLVESARQAADNCSGHLPLTDGMDGSLQESDNTVLAYSRRGWTGVRSLTEGRIGQDTDSPDSLRPFARATTVASRGGLLAEVTWKVEGESGGGRKSSWRERGESATESVLAAVGGDPSRPAPQGPSDQAALTALAHALPAASSYVMREDAQNGTGQNSDGSSRTTDDLTCSGLGLRDEGVASGAPVAVQLLRGQVLVRQDVAVLPDERTAEKTRTLLLPTYHHYTSPCWTYLNGSDGSSNYDPDPPPAVMIPRRVEPFRYGNWHGQVESFAVRRGDLPPHPTYRDSVAHIAVALRRGNTVFYMRWQGPAAANLKGALVRGRSAVTRSLDALPSR